MFNNKFFIDMEKSTQAIDELKDYTLKVKVIQYTGNNDNQLADIILASKGETHKASFHTNLKKNLYDDGTGTIKQFIMKLTDRNTNEDTVIELRSGDYVGVSEHDIILINKVIYENYLKQIK